ncbi:MAG: Hpt domain-containing protein [Deltaproteobacteria bacterium]|nr:Hpt domain-containing protein [Deltaproteobacteria bacterium]
MNGGGVGARLMETYLAEMAEHVATCNRELAAIERGAVASDDGARFDTLCRTTHSLKGASQAVRAHVVETACHLFEEALLAARTSAEGERGTLFKLLYDTVDALADAHTRLTQGSPLTGSPLERIMPRLQEAARGARAAPAVAPSLTIRMVPPPLSGTAPDANPTAPPPRAGPPPGAPFREVCDGFEKMVQDLAASTGKDVALGIEGGEVELDQALATALADPLRHLIRNAIDHGIETPAERRAAGKPSPARVVLACRADESDVSIAVMDDGRGLDVAAVQSAAARLGQPAPTTPDDLLRLLCRPGFTTASRVSTVSGRGTGLDAVRSRVDELDGELSLSFRPGLGTRFQVRLPRPGLRQAVLRVSAGGCAYALPIRAVEAVVRMAPSELRALGGRAYRMVGERSLPVVPLDLLADPGSAANPIPPASRPYGVVLATESAQAVVAVEGVGTLERASFVRTPATGGARNHRLGSFTDTSGTTVVVLDPAEVVARARHATWPEAGASLAAADRSPDGGPAGARGELGRRHPRAAQAAPRARRLPRRARQHARGSAPHGREERRGAGGDRVHRGRRSRRGVVGGPRRLAGPRGADPDRGPGSRHRRVPSPGAGGSGGAPPSARGSARRMSAGARSGVCPMRWVWVDNARVRARPSSPNRRSG